MGGIELTRAQALQVYTLYEMCVSADRHYHSCQSDLYRRMVRDTVQAANVTEAFKALKAKLDEAMKEA